VLTTAFTDRRSAAGIQVPYSIVTTAGADRMVDELLFDEVVVNPPLTKADFSR
jgi:ABC-type phosphate/phosphonate transport system substrate-binding protein